MFSLDLHGDFREVCVGWLGSNPVCCNNTVTCVYSTSVIGAVACCPCQLMHSLLQQNSAVGWLLV